MPWSFDEDGIKVRCLEAVSAAGTVERFAGVLDLGAGAGLWRNRSKGLAIGATRWTAVEVFPKNIRHYQLRDRYDAVRVADFRKIKYGAFAGHLFIFGDVLEHLERRDAVDVVRRAASVGTVIVVMPFHPTTSAEQGAVDGNEWERHRYIWSWDEWATVLADVPARNIEVIETPSGIGRNKGAMILWHPSHRSAP